MALETLIRPSQFREVKEETERLVARCLTGDWCVQLRRTTIDKSSVIAQNAFHQDSPSQEVLVSTSHDTSQPQPRSATVQRSSSISKPIKSSRSFDNLKAALSPRVESCRRTSGDSTGSFGGLPTATVASPRKPSKSGSLDNGTFTSQQYTALHKKPPLSPGAVSLPSTSSTTQKSRRPPPPPPKRRTTAVGVTNGGAIMTAIASSSAALKNRR